MMKVFVKSVYIVVLITHCSCISHFGIRGIVKGFWAIDFIEYSQNQNILYECGSNILIFKRNTVSMPVYREDADNPLKRNGKWKITREGEQYFLTIDTENEIFAGTHKICFKKDYENRLIKMIIQSDYLYLEASKGLFNFDKDNYKIDNYLCK